MRRTIKILFATDFSPRSREALDTIKKLKTVYSVDIQLIHVVSSFWKDWFSSGSYQKEAMERLKTWQANFLNEHDQKKLHVQQGNPADCIVSLGRELKTHLIFMAFHGKNDHDRYKTHHTVESVVRHAKQSVWVAQSKSISHLLCGVDGSETSIKALKKAIELCHHFQAKLELVFVYPHVDFNPIGLSKYQIKGAEEAFKEKYTQEMEALLSKIEFSGIKVKKHYQWGVPSEVILDMTEDLGVDLVILGAKGKHPFRHVLIGSTAGRVLRYAPCSLWIVR